MCQRVMQGSFETNGIADEETWGRRNRVCWGLDREARGDGGGELATCGVRLRYSARAPREAPGCPQGSRILACCVVRL